MDKGIRVNVNRVFVDMLPQRAELGNTEFRRAVMNYAITEFGLTVSQAATHYNQAFKVQKAANPESVEGLGRAEDKKGGRKPKAKAVDAVFVDAESIVPETFSVYAKKDGALVAQDLSFDAARETVAKGRNGKGHYCKMYWL